MIDLRNYGILIRELVEKEDEKDPNWKWSVKYIGKTKVRIRWGYLDYLGEKKNCFSIEIQSWGEGGEWLWACLPDGSHVECFLVVEGVPNPKIGAEQSIKSGIEDAIFEIAHYAHTYY